MLIIDDEEALLARGIEGLALVGRAVDDLDREVGEHGPFAGPLGLEAGRGDDQAALDPAGPPEHVARGDRLRGLAQSHVVGQEEAARVQEPLDALALIGVERRFMPAESLADLGGGERLLDDQS